MALLLSKGADPNLNSCGCVPLHRSAYAGHYECCRLLAEANADLNVRDSSFGDLNTPLHKAISQGHVNVTNLLLARGADVNILNAQGISPRMLLSEESATLRDLDSSLAGKQAKEADNEEKEGEDAVGISSISSTGKNAEAEKDRESVQERESYKDSEENGAPPHHPPNMITTDVSADLGMLCVSCGTRQLIFARCKRRNALICTQCKQMGK